MLKIKKYKKSILILITIGLISVLSIYVFQINKWKKYYTNKLYQPARDIIIEALDLFKKENIKPDKAIDLGSGVGNETALLLKNGWKVWAIDSQNMAIKTLLDRKDIKENLANLKTIVWKFEDINWNLLPNVNLIVASYSLPFCNPKDFDNLWKNLINKLNINGRFAGHFFGTKYQGFSQKEMSKMTFLTKQQIHNLFKDFKIEKFEEVYEKGLSGTGNNIIEHSFKVIAKKIVG